MLMPPLAMVIPLPASVPADQLNVWFACSAKPLLVICPPCSVSLSIVMNSVRDASPDDRTASYVNPPLPSLGYWLTGGLLIQLLLLQRLVPPNQVEVTSAARARDPIAATAAARIARR